MDCHGALGSGGSPAEGTDRSLEYFLNVKVKFLQVVFSCTLSEGVTIFLNCSYLQYNHSLTLAKMQSNLMGAIESFSVKSLKSTETHITTPQGKQVRVPNMLKTLFHYFPSPLSKFIEKKDSSGETLVLKEYEDGLGFCPDLMTQDLSVGVAMDGVFVGSEDVAQDLSLLRELGITHILNVAYGVPNTFPSVSSVEELNRKQLYTQKVLQHYCTRVVPNEINSTP